MKTLCVLAVSVVGLGCVGSSAVTRAGERQSISLEDARAIVAGLGKTGADAAVPQPKTLDEAVELLKSDEIRSFEAAVEFASKDASPQGKALKAQLELAWGEAQHVVSDLINRATFNLKEERQLLSKRAVTKGLNDKEQARLKTLDNALDEMSGVSVALTRLGDDHIATGIKDAKAVIDGAPNEYLGYRVAADFYRLTEDWTNFDVTVKKLEELNPKSNGLVFAKAMEALQRKNDRPAAVALLKQALETDPKFTRARAQLLLAESNVDAAWADYEALKAVQPRHQIVAWIGPTLEAERESLIATVDRSTSRSSTLEMMQPRPR